MTLFRFYIRYITSRGPKQIAYFVCDGFVLVALIATVVFTACDVWLQTEKARVGVKLGSLPPTDYLMMFMKVGSLICQSHRSYIPWEENNADILRWGGAVQINFASYFTYLISLWSVKAAFLSTYFVVAKPLRLSNPQLFCWLIVASVFTGVSMLLCMLYTLGSCQPLSRNWYLFTHMCTFLILGITYGGDAILKKDS